ncbi:hypothetical protein GCM10011351_27330 [Paraliobacillus quinghaiensis]|uniref:Uncharacterized protein n=1 Tax=Paraliobacillus quinghaiensis TaxID=470815 RepID=A0A917TVB9_9BACI|nr:hypothetical protein GCM10011351_27330 [Paraliobacillus quinghaiensis]
MPTDSFAGKININIVTTKTPRLGIPVFVNPIKIAQIPTITHCKIDKSKIRIPPIYEYVYFTTTFLLETLK